MQFAKMHWDYIAILAVLAVLVPWRSTTRIQKLLESAELESGQRIALYLSTIAFQWAVSAVILWRTLAHGMDISELGLAAPHVRRIVAVTVALTVILALNQVFGMKRLASLPREKRGLIAKIAEKLLPRTWSEAVVGIALVATVAICEEFIYRGFIQGIFQGAFGSSMMGAVISAAFFAIAHLYQGRRGLVTTFIVGLIFSWARVWTGSLAPSMIIHFVVDFSAAMAASRLLLRAETQDGADT